MAQGSSALASQYPLAVRIGLPLLGLKPAERKYFKTVKTKFKKRLRLYRGVHITVRNRADLTKLRMIEEALSRSTSCRELIEHSFNRHDSLDETASLAFAYDDLMLSGDMDGMSKYRHVSRWIERMMQAVYGSDHHTGIALLSNVPVRDRERIGKMIRLDHSLKNQYLPSHKDLVALLFQANDADYESYAELVAVHDTMDAARVRFLHEGGPSALADGAL